MTRKKDLGFDDSNVIEIIKLMRQLVSDVQGAPFPGEKIEPELYSIWYEHVQRGAQNCYEYLEEHFPVDNNSEINEVIDKVIE